MTLYPKMPASNRSIPAVDKVLRELENAPLPRGVLCALVRRELEEIRKTGGGVESYDEFIGDMREKIRTLVESRIRPVVNGTGVMIHTNLGRSPVSPEAARKALAVATGYCNLEIDLLTGERSGRAAYLEAGLAALCESEAATIVNNCAAALVLILRRYTADSKRKEVIISRGELVEIGGGFRIPEILQASGATLREVGATNKTSIEDYRKAIGPETAMILKVHRSNFYIGGFTAEPDTESLSALAREHGIAIVEDLGSGAMVDTAVFGLDHEPTAAEVLRRGVDLVCVSGDKLFGGIQAGIIAGSAEGIAALKKEPFFRALRCDKVAMTLLQETMARYLKDETGDGIDVPLMSMLSASVETLQKRAEQLVASLADTPGSVEVTECQSRLGGGTMPRSGLASCGIAIKPSRGSITRFARRLRESDPAVVGFVHEEKLCIDLRTVPETQDNQLADVLRTALAR